MLLLILADVVIARVSLPVRRSSMWQAIARSFIDALCLVLRLSCDAALAP
jgi:hypothetical protein